jgi:rsbT co-antagonist protein RsbR
MLDGSVALRDAGQLTPIDEDELRRRKEWLQFTDEDEARVVALDPLAQRYADEVIEELYDHFLANDMTSAFFPTGDEVDRVKRLQREYFRRLTQGNYDVAYAADRVKIGATHQRIGLDMKWYLGAYSFYIRAVTARIMPTFEDAADGLAHWQALKKLVFLDIGLALDTYLAAREQVITEQQGALRELATRQQQETIKELSTPVLQIRAGLLMLPIVGAIDSLRAQMVTQSVLAAIRDRRGRVVVIDITGVPGVDSAVANHLVQTVEACRLMGAAVIVTGLSPEVAQTLVTLGIDLSKMRTVIDLEGGLAAAEELIGAAPADVSSDG